MLQEIYFSLRCYSLCTINTLSWGASGYEVFREGKFTRHLGLGSKLGVERIAAGSAKGSHSRSQQKTAIDVTRIGVIEMQDSMHTHSAT